MLFEMPFEKITVCALVGRCEVSSNTFYYHFRDIYDLLDVWMNEKKKEYLEEVGSPIYWTDHLKIALKSSRKILRLFIISSIQYQGSEWNILYLSFWKKIFI